MAPVLWPWRVIESNVMSSFVNVIFTYHQGLLLRQLYKVPTMRPDDRAEAGGAARDVERQDAGGCEHTLTVTALQSVLKPGFSEHAFVTGPVQDMSNLPVYFSVPAVFLIPVCFLCIFVTLQHRWGQDRHWVRHVVGVHSYHRQYGIRNERYQN